MLSESEQEALRQKILEYRPLFEDNRGKGCLLKGLRLYEVYSGGILLWVSELSQIGLDCFINHAYFFPPNSSETDIALNLADNGFSQYPSLNKREAMAIGQPQDPDVIRQTILRSISCL